MRPLFSGVGAASNKALALCAPPVPGPKRHRVGGAKRDRTADPLRARQVLSQLSYSPGVLDTGAPLAKGLVGLGGFEPPTSPLSGVRSNQLSYRPNPVRRGLAVRARRAPAFGAPCGVALCRAPWGRGQNNLLWAFAAAPALLCKEVIQPQVPLGLPCYDFTPVMNHKVVGALPEVRLPTSFATHSHGVTGGVYKARERIHRGILIRDY